MKKSIMFLSLALLLSSIAYSGPVDTGPPYAKVIVICVDNANCIAYEFTVAENPFAKNCFVSPLQPGMHEFTAMAASYEHSVWGYEKNAVDRINRINNCRLCSIDALLIPEAMPRSRLSC